MNNGGLFVGGVISFVMMGFAIGLSIYFISADLSNKNYKTDSGCAVYRQCNNYTEAMLWRMKYALWKEAQDWYMEN